LPEHLALLLL